MATGTTEFVDTTTAAVFIPELWSAQEIRARESRTVFSKLANRVFEQKLIYGNTIHVPSIGNMTTRSKTQNTAITYETVTETNTNITIATQDYAAMAVEDIINIQANRDLASKYAGKMGYALDLDVDDVLAGLPDDFSQNVGTLANPTLYADWLRAIQYLDDADAPEDERYIVISPAERANMMQMDNFINSDFTTVSKADPRKRGDAIGEWLGIPVYVSTNVEGTNAIGHDNTLFQKEAIALVMQEMPKTRTFYDIDYDCDKVASFILFGTKEMRDDHGVWVKGA